MCMAAPSSSEGARKTACEKRLETPDHANAVPLAMTKNVALLRGINVGGRGLVSMSDLRAMLADLGMADCQTLLQSGNVVLESPRLAGEKLEQLLERETAKRLGAPCDYFVRTAKEWRE